MTAAEVKIAALSDGREVYRCSDCGRWVDADEGATAIRHSSRCDYQAPSTAQPAIRPNAAAIARAANVGCLRQLVSDQDDIVGLVDCGLLSESDAMNQDF